MQKTLAILGGPLAAAVWTQTSLGALQFDADVTPDVIFGSGNDNGAFAVDRASGVELGLRAKLRFDDNNQPQNVFNSNGDGTYTYDATLPPTGFGFASGSTSTAIWNFEWSINSDFDGSSGLVLGDLAYLFEIDFDAGPGTNFLSFDPINIALADHAIGNNGTGNGGGSVATDATSYSSLIDTNNVAQNSWNMEFFDDASNGFLFNGGVPGVYDFRLTALDSAGDPLAQTSIQVKSVPVPTTLALVAFGVIGAAIGRRRARR